MGARNANEPATGHAVVLGASLAGLLAARVLSDYFDHVTIVERDVLPSEAAPRKGVPQARHAHALLARGFEACKRWFPGIEAGLVQGGAVMFDLGAETHWWHHDGYKVRYQSGLIGPAMSRPLLEEVVRRRVLARTGVSVLDGMEASTLRMDGDRARVSGVMLQSRRDDDPAVALETDLVVDATGRGSQTPRWLRASGYPAPPEVSVTMHAGYSSRLYRRTATDLPDAKLAFCLPTPPHQKRMGALFPIEGDRWIVSLGGWHHDHAPADERGFLEFARGLPIPHIYRVISRAEPVSGFFVHKFPSNLRRRYEALESVPEGLIVIGDAMCSFNPIFGQGMTVAALQAEALEACLQAAIAGRRWAGLPKRYYARAAKAIDNPWRLAAGADFEYPETIGTKAFGTDLINRYTAAVHRAARRDPVVCHAFYEVMNLLRRPTALFRPRILRRVFRSVLSERAAAKRGARHATHSQPAEEM
jgi:2-polyprenyl-6-methoxyphenol hydroxylase-like FAD-dependent oxidoreductase